MDKVSMVAKAAMWKIVEKRKAIFALNFSLICHIGTIIAGEKRKSCISAARYQDWDTHT